MKKRDLFIDSSHGIQEKLRKSQHSFGNGDFFIHKASGRSRFLENSHVILRFFGFPEQVIPESLNKRFA